MDRERGSACGARVRQWDSGTVGQCIVCTYVGGGGVAGGAAPSATAGSWDSPQSTPVSLGRGQRDQNTFIVTTPFSIGFYCFVDLHTMILRIESALLRVLSIDHIDT